MRYLSHARPVVRDLSSVCPTVRLPTLSHLPHQRSTPRSATTTPHSPTTSTAATRSSAWSSSPSSSSSVSTPARAPSRRPSESSRACTRNQPCHVVDHGCPAALRQASCRHGSGGRGAETIYSNNGPRVIRGALDFQFQCVPRFFPFANLRSRHTRRAPTHARPTAFVYDRRRTSLALQEQARPSKPSAPPSEQAHHPAAHASAHGALQLSHVQMCTQLTLPAFSAPAAVLLRPRRASHTRLPQTPCR